MRLTDVAIDGNPDEVIQGYTDDTSWNGWLNVYLTLEQLLAWIDQSPYDYRVLDNGNVRVYFEDEQTFIPSTITIDGEVVTVYDMNGYCFEEIE